MSALYLASKGPRAQMLFPAPINASQRRGNELHDPVDLHRASSVSSSRVLYSVEIHRPRLA